MPVVRDPKQGFLASPRFLNVEEHAGDPMYRGSTKFAPATQPHAGGSSQPLALDSRDLFTRHTRVLIRHGPDTYTLRLTRQGKLILTK